VVQDNHVSSIDNSALLTEIEVAELLLMEFCKVMDGERGNEYRRRLLPTYKANRKRFVHNQLRWISSKNKDVDLRTITLHRGLPLGMQW
jgi:hypothetical protein